MRVFIQEDSPEITTLGTPKLVSYHMEIEAWTVQDMTGSSGDQMTDQGNIMRMLETILTQVQYNNPWGFVAGFLHLVEGASSLTKNNELYQGKDVMVSVSNFDILIQE